MAATDTASKAGQTLARLADNEYAQAQLGDAVRNLQGAYSRATSRKAAKAADDKKVHKRLSRAASSLSEGVTALSRDRKKPKRSKRKLLLVGAGLAAAGVIATNEQLRTQLMSAVGAGQQGASDDQSPSPQAA